MHQSRQLFFDALSFLTMTPSLIQPLASSPPSRRYLPIGLKLAAFVIVMFALVGAYGARHLSEQDRGRLYSSKGAAAEMLSELLVATISPAVDFGDAEALTSELGHLRANRDVLYAGVWKNDDSSAPFGEFGTRPKSVLVTKPALLDRVTMTTEWVRVERVVRQPNGTPIGVAAIFFSLAPENARYLETRRATLVYAAVVATGLAALIILLMQSLVVGPLRRLGRAVRQLEQGDAARVVVTSADEVGQLGRAFNTMTAAILDRERRLAVATAQRQELLDHMRQAILVFDSSGIVEEIASKPAELLFPNTKPGYTQLAELLYDGVQETIEARAFAEWSEVVFESSREDWDAIAELAPRTVVVGRGEASERHLALDFIPIGAHDRIERVMLLATDETEKVRLERAVKQQGAAHARQMRAMRRLLAGGGQLLVGLLDRARERLEVCRQILEGPVFERIEVESVFQQVHTIKGEARAFDLGDLETEVTAFEDQLAIVRSRIASSGGLTRDECDKLTTHLTASAAAVERAAIMLVEASPIGAAVLEQVTVRRSDLTEVLELSTNRTDALGEAARRLSARPFGEMLLYLVDTAPTWAAKLGKQAVVSVEGKEVPIPEALARALPGALTHLVRNAVAHGIEPSEERRAKAKPPHGNIVMAAELGPQGLTISVSDDGQGLDQEAIGLAARAIGLPSGIAPEEAVFSSGLTTARDTSELAGRGVGLAAVREELRAAGFGISLQPGSPTGLRAVICSNQSPVERVQRR